MVRVVRIIEKAVRWFVIEYTPYRVIARVSALEDSFIHLKVCLAVAFTSFESLSFFL
jgi:hypothetical protein